MSRKYNIRSIKAFSQMLLYCLIMACGMFFMHTHKLKSGIVVLHIHPYPIDTEQSNSSHNSEKEMLTFDMIFHHSYCIPSIVVLEKPIVELLASISNEPLKVYPQIERQTQLSLRGPPYNSFI